MSASIGPLQLRGGGGKSKVTVTLQDEIAADLAKLAGDSGTAADESIPSDANFSEGNDVSEWHDSDLNIETQMLAQRDIARQDAAATAAISESDNSGGGGGSEHGARATRPTKRPRQRERETSSAAEPSSSASSSGHVPSQKKTSKTAHQHAARDVRERPIDRRTKPDAAPSASSSSKVRTNTANVKGNAAKDPPATKKKNRGSSRAPSEKDRGEYDALSFSPRRQSSAFGYTIRCQGSYACHTVCKCVR